MPSVWIQPQSNSLMDTFAQAESIKHARNANALAEAQAAELPYERERAEALNAANISKAQAQTRSAEATATKTDAEFTLNMVNWLQRDPANEPAVIGAFQFAAGKYPQIAPVLAKLESTRGTPEFKATVDQFSMTAKDKATQLLNDRQFTEQQKQSGIDNQFQQVNADIARTNASTSQANAAESRRFHDASLAQSRDLADARREQTDRRVDTSLRKEFNGLPVVKNYTTVVPIVQSLREAADVDNAAADMNLVYGVAKIMDPESVVRESETAMVVSAGSPAEKYKGMFSYVVGGGRLTPETRKQLMNEVESRAKGHEGLYNDAVKQYQSGAPEIGSLPALGAGRDQSGPGMQAPAPNTSRTPVTMMPPGGQAPAAAQIPAVQSDADYDQLPSGARFTDPQGRVRVKP